MMAAAAFHLSAIAYSIDKYANEQRGKLPIYAQMLQYISAAHHYIIRAYAAI